MQDTFWWAQGVWSRFWCWWGCCCCFSVLTCGVPWWGGGLRTVSIYLFIFKCLFPGCFV